MRHDATWRILTNFGRGGSDFREKDALQRGSWAGAWAAQPGHASVRVNGRKRSGIQREVRPTGCFPPTERCMLARSSLIDNGGRSTKT